MTSQYEMHRKVKLICQQMSGTVVGRDQEVRLILLAALSSHHSLLIGPPGTAKSQIARTVLKAIATPQNDYHAWFQVLLMRFSKPDEIFGPLDIDYLKKGYYRRRTERFLPKASFAFLDEIFKANSAILNSLLTILNEREFYNDDPDKLDKDGPKVPLVSVVGASNELPRPGFADTASDALMALYDRFLVRVWVDSLPQPRFAALLAMYCGESTIGENAERLTLEEVKTAQEESRKVLVPLPIRDLLVNIRQKLFTHTDAVTSQIRKAEREQDAAGMRPPFYVSDRRWGWILEILRVSAWYDGRQFVSLLDLQLLLFLLPCHETDIVPVQKVLFDIATVLSDRVEKNVLATIANAESERDARNISTCVVQLEALATVIRQAIDLDDMSDQLKVHTWLTETTLESIACGNPAASLKDAKKTKAQFNKLLEKIEACLNLLRTKDMIDDEVEEPGTGDDTKAVSAPCLEIPEFKLKLSLLQPPAESGLGTKGWPGETPTKAVYISESPVLWQTWNEVMSERNENRNPTQTAVPGTIEKVKEFLRQLQWRLDATINTATRFSARLMTLDEWRIATWHAACRRSLAELQTDEQFRARVQCSDGYEPDSVLLPRSNKLQHCSEPELYSLIGSKRQLCIADNYLLVGGASHYTYERCVETIRSPEIASEQLVAHACFRIVLEPVDQ